MHMPATATDDRGHGHGHGHRICLPLTIVSTATNNDGERGERRVKTPAGPWGFMAARFIATATPTTQEQDGRRKTKPTKGKDKKGWGREWDKSVVGPERRRRGPHQQ